MTHNYLPPTHESRTHARVSILCASEQFVTHDMDLAETLAYLSAEILMDYVLQEPRYLHLKFDWRIAAILKTKIHFSLASDI